MHGCHACTVSLHTDSDKDVVRGVAEGTVIDVMTIPSTSLVRCKNPERLQSHMDIFTHIVSTLIGILISVLPAGSADLATNASASTTPETVGALVALRAQLVDFQQGLRAEDVRIVSDDGEDKNTKEHTDESDGQHTRISADGEHRAASSDVRGETRTRMSDDGGGRDVEDDAGDDEGDDDGQAATVTQQAGTSANTGGGTGTQASVTAFTAAQVAAHASVSSCYSIVNGSVYDLTPWISKHPGGPAAITGLCGKDGSAAFNGQHGGQARPASELAGFKIGVVAK